MLSYLRTEGESALEGLKQKEDLKEADWTKLDAYLPAKPVRPRGLPAKPALLAEMRLRVMDKEKSELRGLYEEGVISQSVFRRLMNSLDELYDVDGNLPLDQRHSIFQYCDRIFHWGEKFKLPKMHELLSFVYRRQLTSIYELGHGFYLLQRSNLVFVEQTYSANVMNRAGKDQLKALRKEIESNINRMDAVLSRIAEHYPKAHRHALTHIAIRMLLSDEQRRLVRLVQQGVLSEEGAHSLAQSIAVRRSQLTDFTHSTFYLLFRKLFH